MRGLPMTSRPIDGSKLEVQPLTRERWDDLERLFGKHGAYGGCWCMWWRITRREFEQGQGDGNRKAMRSMVESGVIPGLLGYLEGEPVGWCSVAPREHYGSLERSPVLKRLDDQPVWSIVCLYIAKGRRGQGVAEALLRGAIGYVHQQGGSIVEAYPTVVRSENAPPVSVFMGTPELFRRVGFRERARPSKSKVIMRLELE